jgi:hypothetical protein
MMITESFLRRTASPTRYSSSAGRHKSISDVG